MKALSRIHIWFPNIDKVNENEVRSCHECAKEMKNPTKAFIHPWSWAAKPFDKYTLISLDRSLEKII